MRFAVLLTGLAVGLLACGEEGPTEVGGGLGPAREICTFEQVLPAARFLVVDTAFRSPLGPVGALYLLVAHQYGGELDARILSRVGTLPGAIGYTDPDGAASVDSMPRYVGGRLILRVDSARALATDTVRLRLYHTTERWDPYTATWTMRVDSGTVRHEWAEPGGSPGEFIGEAVWAPGQDSVAFPVDSVTLGIWSDTLLEHRGVIITVADSAVRLRATRVLLRADARVAALPDTLLPVTASAAFSTFLYSPQAPATGALQVGGTPAWRSVLRFAPRLDTLMLSDPLGRPGCSGELGAATVNFASLILQPVAVPKPFMVEDSLLLDARAVRESEYYPLSRAPLGEWVGRLGAPLVPDLFGENGPADGSVALTLTSFVANLASRDTAVVAPELLALVARTEASSFGFGAFSGAAGASPPRLRLIVTVAGEVRF